ncbi:MAG: hypothetical protein IPG50_30245 [Myxococcales bacterium]|nr:hypothetical protein [Myxococcales bacterium]
MRLRFSAIVSGLLVAAACLGTMADGPEASAQQPKKDRKRPPKPAAAAVVDAGAAEAKADDDKEKDKGAPLAAAGDAGAAIELGDGGTRISPLTPLANELPLASDAGTVDYDRLIADIASLRTRVAAVGEGLFQSRMTIALRLEGERARPHRLTVSVDDGVVYTSPQGFRGDEMTPVFGRALAPGRHAVTVDVEREDRENAAYKSGQRSRFIVEVSRDEQLDVELRVEDDSTMGDLPSKKGGRYDLRVRMKANARALKK